VPLDNEDGTTPNYGGERIPNLVTGEDAANFFARNRGTASIKFVHLNSEYTGDDYRPYDLLVVRPEDTDKEHMVCSAMGMVRQAPHLPSQFTPLGDWMRERSMFYNLRSLRFFKYFKIAKAYRFWHKNVRYKLYCQQRNKVKQRLFLAKDSFVSALTEINQLCVDMRENTKVADVGLKAQGGTMLSEFTEMQTKQRAKATTEFEGTYQQVEALLEKVCEDVTTRANLSDGPGDEGDQRKVKVRGGAKSKSMFAMRQEHLDRQRALKKAEEEAQMLGDFVRLADYILVENLVLLSIDTVRYFLDLLIHNKQQIKTKQRAMFQTAIGFVPGDITFGPSLDDVDGTLKSMIDGIENTVNAVPRLLYTRSFKAFFEGQSVIGPTVTGIIKDSVEFKGIQNGIDEELHIDFVDGRAEVEDYEQYRKVFDFGQTWDYEEFMGASPSPRDIQIKMKELSTWSNEVEVKMPAYKTVGMLHIDGKKLKSILVPYTKDALDDMRNYLKDQARDKCEEVLKTYQDNVKILSDSPERLEAFAEFVQNKEDMKSKSLELRRNKEMVDGMYALMVDFKVKIETTDKVNLEALQLEVEKFESVSAVAEEYVNGRIPEMNKEIIERNSRLDERCQDLIAKTSLGGDFSDANADASVVLDQLHDIQTQIDEINKDAAVIQTQVNLFKLPSGENTNLEAAVEQHKSRLMLWNMVNDFNTQTNDWYTSDIRKIDVEELSKVVADTFKEAFKISKAHADDMVAVKLKESAGKWKVWNPVLSDGLCVEALKTRHWKLIYNEIGAPFEEEDFVPCLEVLDANGVFEQKEFVLETAGIASGEYTLELGLEKIKTEWKDMDFEVRGHRDSKSVFVLGSVEEIMTLLEDSQMSLQTMTASKFVVGVRAQVEEWDKKLQMVSEVLDEWMNCQRNWMYLECIFTQGDIQKQLPEESAKFQQVDKSWSDVMRRTSKNPNVLYATTAKGVLEMFVESNVKLEEIQKSLEEYLETKRGSFPRFYFLSNDELLEILAQTRDPQAVQPHMRKCFDCISKLEFTDEPESVEIRAMVSPEKERVEFHEPVFAKGSVEHWLTTIEGMMRQSLYYEMKRSVDAYSAETRKQWFFEWPAAVIIAVDQIHWGTHVENALTAIETGENKNAVKEFFQHHMKDLNDMAEVVGGDLTGEERGVMGATIVIDVHAREVLRLLIDENCSSITAFDWNKQLRYYWDDDVEEQGDKYTAPQGDCNVRQTNTCSRYGYEMLGNSMRLVITPLTDKCYMTLTGALHARLGGAPAGPAGTGKTETTKDLGKALAYICVVFNCSDGLDYKLMGRFFSGLAQAGAWACFDEFNRIDIEVLSVIAQQVMTIAQSLQASLHEFDFEGRHIPLNWKYGSFITMNPGYAGRSELPDNLKACFRPVAMMVPDYALIAEIMLFSEGFTQSKVLSRKMAQLYRLSSEQLSSQSHYDFGMRAVKSVLVMAGQLKRSNPTLTEDIVLIRALRDSNVPKFLADDIPLFFAIINDLFPGVEIPNVDYGELQVAIEYQLVNNGLQCVPSYITKIIQLFETLQVRHGVMVVGVTMTGKSTIFDIMAQALKKLKDDGVPHPLRWFENVVVNRLNPKSITMNELYGNFDLMTNEWTDGLVPVIIREMISVENADRKWIIFDGPVDAIWIENMNTVLDDNKTLCLSNGERIKLPGEVCTMFEVNDLAVASPATVSRVGIVFAEPRYLTWVPISQTWMANMEPRINGITELLTPLLEKTIDPALTYLRKRCKEPFASMDVNLVTSCLTLLDSLMYKPAEMVEETAAKEKELKYLAELPAPEKEEQFAKLFKMQYTFCFIWSLGGNIDDDSRVKFDQFAREIFKEMELDFPEDATIYDYLVDHKTTSFVGFDTIMDEFKYDPEQSFSSVLVPTVDTTRLKYLLGQSIAVGYNSLVVGNTGVGKTVGVQQFLTQLDPDRFVYAMANFSAKTSAQNVREFLEDKLDKRRKNLLGPPSGKKMVFYVDDLNMPMLEEYGAQPPIEIMRQTVEGGFYDQKKVGLWKEVADCQFLCSCGPPGGGRNTVTPRMLRHMHMLCIPDLSVSSMKVIFASIIGGFLTAFPEDFGSLTTPIVNATTTVYQRCCESLLPTPSKSHYTFNLRDLAKVIQGVLQATPKWINTREKMVQLWNHESLRVFADRLTDQPDKTWFTTMLQELSKAEFNVDFELEALADTLFGDFLSQDPMDKPYREIDDPEKVQQLLLEYQEDYVINYNKPMDLVFFKDAVGHLSRICRVLRQPRGCAMLVGVGGSGRSSLCKLATHMNEFAIYSIEVSRGYGLTEFRENIKELLFKCGVDNIPHTFLFSDTQIVEESFLEDINGLLNAGEVPSLFANDETERIIGGCRERAKAEGLETRDGIWAHFIATVRTNMHIVLAMSPVGDDFRSRLRQFPSLVNCCTIDWFLPWPEDALLSVANKYFAKVDLGSDEMKAGLCTACVAIHMSVTHIGVKFLQQLRRNTYTTPTSYLSLLDMYSSLLGEQREKITENIRRYQGGIDKIESTKVMVAEMQESLAELQPVLEEAMASTAVLVEQLTIDKADASVQAKACQEEGAVVAKATLEAKAIGADAQKDLDLAMPAFASAVKALKSLNKNDITEIKSFAKPPALVQTTMEAVCILKGAKPDWDSAKKLLGDGGFLQSLETYDKDNIPAPALKKLSKYINNPDFTVEIVGKVSSAAKSLCMWVHAMDVYSKVAKNVEPKKAALKKANEEVAEMSLILQAKNDELAGVEAKVAKLNAQYEESMAKKANLEQQAADTVTKLERADKLVGGLGGELVRWKEEVLKLDAAKGNLVGSMILASGVVAYNGPFTAPFRQELVTGWVAECQKLGIPVDGEFTLEACLGEPVKIQAWNIFSLPSDALSIENGIMTEYTKRWPLMIDPQGQANRWVKNMERGNGLQVIKLTTPNFLKMVENCIRVGTPVLLENVAEVLDPSLEPVIGKQLFKSAGRWMLRLGDTDVDYNEDFKFYVTTKLPNPHYPPEVCVKLTIINFTVTLRGLEDQLLGNVVGHERPDLEEQNNELVVQIADGEKKIYELEGEILTQLANASGDILADDVLINTLAASKTTSNEVAANMKVAGETKIGIDIAREKYRIAATRGSILYFVVADMGMVNDMYQYSLVYFVQVFETIMATSEKNDDLSKRLETLISFSTEFVYTTICRGLFEQDKPLFSFLIAAQIYLHAGDVDDASWNFVLRGAGLVDIDALPPNPHEDWLPVLTWANAIATKEIKGFETLTQSIAGSDGAAWKNYMTCDAPQDEKLPGAFENLSPFNRLVILKVFRPEKLVFGVPRYVAEVLGQKFIEPPPFDLATPFKDSSPTTPMIFVLSSGADINMYLMDLAAIIGAKVRSVSLGQGQGPLAERHFREGADMGDWVALQNCHLATSWMPSLEKLCEEMMLMDLHDDFRLWLTSMPSNKFPIPVLQIGIKLTNEPPKGLKANLTRTFIDMKPETFESCSKPVPFKKLCYGLAFFHSVIMERRKYGAVGWNIRYEWTVSDFQISVLMLKNYLEENEQLPMQILNYVTSVVNYGGRITDSNDIRIADAILSQYYSEEAITDGFKLSTDGEWIMPPTGDLGSYQSFISSLPMDASPTVFGLHENANITFQMQTTTYLINTALSLQSAGGSGGGGKTPDETVDEVAADIESRMPDLLDLDDAHPTTFARMPDGNINALSNCLGQEIAKFNRMLGGLKNTLTQLRRSIKGLVVMSSELEAMFNSFFNGQVPGNWTKISYISLKPLGSWFADLVERVIYFRKWLGTGKVNALSLPSFFFPQGALTSALQIYSRQTKTAIDSLAWRSEVTRLMADDITGPPKTGVYVYGLFIEGARWDKSLMGIAESTKGTLYEEFPVIWLDPCGLEDPPPPNSYSHPIYKVSTRAGTLSTTGHSTNFVMFLNVPAGREGSTHWVKRGVAFLCLLDT
jgi:dynein heavy chain